MKCSTYLKGAEWRKWDLHVHTPLSVYQKYGQNNEETWKKYIQDLENLPSEFAVIGVNDYLFIDGYEKLINEQIENDRISNLKLFPVVEFRIEKFAGVQFGALKRINLHVIFSDEVPVETIRSQFLNTLEQSYTLESGEKWTRAITPNSVKELGASIKSAIPTDKASGLGSDLVVGFNNLNVKEDQVFNSLKKDCFNGKYLIAIGKTEWSDLKWSDASIATKKSIINEADIVFTSATSVENFVKSKSQLTEQGVNDFLIDCSDAHYFSTSNDKDRIGNCFTWLKADPTFDGLKQVINEPVDRVYVGDKPPLLDRVSKNRTKYIKKLTISQVEGYKENNNTWFKDVTIPLNNELVAIIGNKGSGKSAVADILSLCSNYRDHKDFSFLTSSKFRAKSGRLAKNFDAVLTWESGNKDRKNLNDSPVHTEITEVKYLPQGRFERLTNEISTAVEFQKEIESVVFSHIPDTEKLGTSSFSELISKKTVTVDSELATLLNAIKDINKTIISLENKNTEEYKLEIKNKLNKKNEELKALQEPEQVLDPNTDPDKRKEHEAVNNKITEIRNNIEETDKYIEASEAKKKELIQEIQILNNAKSKIIQKETEYAKLKEELHNELSSFDVDIDSLISVKVNSDQINEILTSKENMLEDTRLLLGESSKKDPPDNSQSVQSLYEKQKSYHNQLKSEKGKLDSEQQVFQNYLTAKNNWEKDRKAIIGTNETPNTISYFKSHLSYLTDKISDELEKKYEDRRKITRHIFDKKQEIISIYKTARKRLNEIISDNSGTLKGYKIEVDASLVKGSDFNSKFLSHILQNKMGSFHSKEGAEKELNTLTSEINFDDKESVINLLDNIIKALKMDKRAGQNNDSRIISEQVKDMQSLYDYLFSLTFLANNYQLKQGDKAIEQLSPGERGALLLVFYLLLDRNDIPLIIDQPEDNLDNHSVATILVPFIRAAKNRRQIIMVTHNPNLAVVSDAEQIIYVELDKENHHTFSTLSGSIEDKHINEKIVEVLEGAMPAFNTRKKKYYES